MKKIVGLIIAIVVATVLQAQQNGNQPQKTPSERQKECLELESEDTTDVLAIPLDEDAYDQCEELDRLEQGEAKKPAPSTKPAQ